MDQTPDRARMRRKYLVDKTAAKSQKIVGAIVILACASPALMFVGCLILCVIAFLVGSNSETLTRATIIAVAGLLFFLYVTILGFWIFITADEKDQSITYVPPVHEQILSLPAGEVLLRGSESSVGPHEGLLRPSVCQPTTDDNLLRPATGSKK